MHNERLFGWVSAGVVLKVIGWWGFKSVPYVRVVVVGVVVVKVLI